MGTVCGAAVLFPLLLFFLSMGSNEAVDRNCNFSQNMTSGKTYYAYNPGYPQPYTGRRSCRWYLRSSYRIWVSCEVSIPSSANCSTDTLTIHTSEREEHRYCGKTEFTIESDGPELLITFDSIPWSSGGTFLCAMVAIEENQESNCQCGWKKPTRIVGGVESGINEYPMMAGMVDFLTRKQYCGATIISPKYVLTAAHCLIERDYQVLGVVVGEHDLSTGTDTNATKLFTITGYKLHPNYEKGVKDFDIAIVAVNGRIDFNNDVGPACLPFEHRSDSFAGDYVTVLGWGTTEFGGSKSNVLLKATLSVITNRQCRRYFTVTSRQMCTYAENKDACQFDSGGPVLWQNPTTRRLVLVGIISYGGTCGEERPGVNTRVGQFIDWIFTTVPDAGVCMIE